MAYIRGDRDQHLLFPPSVDDFIPPDDPVRAYDAFVEQLDLHQLGIVVDHKQAGPPEFDPRVMLKILVYGTAYGIRASRKLERACHHNLSFIWLTANLKPDHMTIARFRRNHRDALSNVLKQCARLCLKLGLVEGNTLFVDGTKIKANASVDHSWHKDRWEERLNCSRRCCFRGQRRQTVRRPNQCSQHYYRRNLPHRLRRCRLCQHQRTERGR